MANNPSISQLSSSWDRVTSPIAGDDAGDHGGAGAVLLRDFGRLRRLPAAHDANDRLSVEHPDRSRSGVRRWFGREPDRPARPALRDGGGGHHPVDGPDAAMGRELSWVGEIRRSSGGGIVPGLAIPSYQVGANSKTPSCRPRCAICRTSRWSPSRVRRDQRCDLPDYTSSTGQSAPDGTTIVPCPPGHYAGLDWMPPNLERASQRPCGPG